MARRSTSSRRILILSASAGGPQRACADAVHRYFRTCHPKRVNSEVLDFLDAFAPNASVLARLAYQRPEPFFPYGTGDLSSMSPRWGQLPLLQEMMTGGIERFEGYLDQNRPDAVMATFPFAAAIAAEVTRGKIPVSLVLTDFGIQQTWIHPGVDLVFVPTREVLEELVVLRVPYDRICVSGVPVHDRFSTALSKKDCRKELGVPDRFTALLVGGAAADLKAIASGLVRAGVRVIAAAGKEDRARRQLEPVAESSEALRLVDGSSMQVLMAASDVLVAPLSGSVVFEALTSGLPSVIYTPVPGQELHNADYLVNAGAALMARDEPDAIEKVRYLSSHVERLVQMQQAAASLSRRDATQAVCERVLAGL